MTRTICMHYYITGLVQGVCFRSNTLKQARALKLAGWVRNLPDERVEVLAVGSLESMQAFESWLKMGPKRAKVDAIEKEERPLESYSDFQIR